MGSYPIPTFQENELLSFLNDNANITYTVDIKSEFKPDAITSNFKKYEKDKKTGDKYVVSGGKGVKVTHLLDNTVKCFVAVNPYRNGSKTTVAFQIPIVGANTNIVDAAPQLNAVIHKLTAIVNE